MKKRMISILTLLFCLPLVGGAQVVRLDLQKCREMALENSQKMAIAEQQQQKASSEWKSYRANFLPKLSATGFYGYMQKKSSFSIAGGYLPTFVPGIDGELHPNTMNNPTTGQPLTDAEGNPVFNSYAYMPDIDLELSLRGVYSIGLTLEQPIYMGGKVRSAYRMASLGREMAEINLRYNRAEVLTEADGAYWQYLRVCELVTSAEKYEEVVAALVKNLTDAHETGMASRNDLLKAQVKLNEAKLMVQKARNGKAVASMNLCRVVGIDLHATIQVSDTLDGEITPGVLSDEAGLENRPDYGLLAMDEELKSRQVALTRSDFLPQVGVMASYAYSGGIELNGDGPNSGSFAAMASLSVPIYHWGEGRGKVKALKAEQEMSRLKKEEMSQLMLLEIARARYNIEDAALRVELTRQSLAQADENLNVSRNQYELGLETLTNYLEAQAQWQKAWSDWIDAKADLRLQETYYLKATGRLN